MLGGLLALGSLTPALAAGSSPPADIPAPGSTIHRLGSLGDAHDTAGPLDLRSASLTQTGPQLTLVVRTERRWRAGELRAAGPRSLCVDLIQRRRTHRICAGSVSSHNGAPAVRVATGTGSAHRIDADVHRPDMRTLRASFGLDAAGLAPGAITWRVISHWSGAPGCGTPCSDRMPDGAPARARVRPVVSAGCVPRGPHFVFHGPRSRREVAMTFDDGPNPPYTQQILGILKRNHIHATFFLIGEQVRPNGALVRRELAEGNVVGNHTYTHANVSSGGYSQMKRTIDAIGSVAHGYHPCVFRFPYGASGGAAIANAHALGMAAIQWDVDPTDWSRPGSGAIYSRVVSAARPGSIILDHDGGGPRNETVAALPHIIHTLKARGYRFVTVPELLGYSTIYR